MSSDKLISNESVRLVPFRWYHLKAMRMREDNTDMFVYIPDFETRIMIFDGAPNCHTAIADGNIVACWGAQELWPHVAECWLFTSTHFNSYPISATRGADRYFNQLAISLKLKRLQLTVNSKNSLAVRWAKRLRFETEGLMRSYGPDGSDYFMTSRIFANE
tara:strand:+ start:1532 stop:2014 length:483 start_codon:yes stop_codon:yes gene_type:complete